MPIGVVVLLGAAALIGRSVTFKQRETLADAEPVNVEADTSKSVPLSPILGGVALATGVVLIVVGAWKSSVRSERTENDVWNRTLRPGPH